MRHSPLPAGFGSLWTAVAVDLIGFGIVIPILPLYAERFDASPAIIGLLLASFSLAQFAAAPFWGRLSDRVGRKPVLVVSLVGTAVGSLLTGLAPSLHVVFLGRLVDGASGGSVAVAQAAAVDLAASDQRPRLLGLLGAAYGIGFVAGPAIGGLAALAGPRVPFLLAGVLAGVNALVTARRLRETRPSGVARPTPPPARLASVRPLLLVAFLMTAAFGAFETTFALLAVRRLELGPSGVSAVFVATGALVAASNTRAVAPAVRRLGDVGALRLGLVLEAIGLALLAATQSLTLLACAICFLAVGHGLAVPTSAAAITNRVAADRRGAALGSQQAAASLARIAGPVLAGAIFGLSGATSAFAVAAGLALGAAVAASALREESISAAVAPAGVELVAP